MKQTQAAAADDRPGGAFLINLFGRRYQLAAEDRVFWNKVAAGEWEAGTLQFFERALAADSVCVDVGAWVGPTALFAAQLCRRVYCVEPDAAAYERLLANIRMNDARNIMPFHGALTATDARASIANPRRRFGNSMTQTTANDGGDDGAATVLGFSLASFIERWGIARVDLLKIDIEGGEFALLPSLAAFIDSQPQPKPALHLSTHAPFLPEHERAEKLTAVAALASRYNFVYDKNNKGIAAHDILGERYTRHFSVAAMSDRRIATSA